MRLFHMWLFGFVSFPILVYVFVTINEAVQWWLYRGKHYARCGSCGTFTWRDDDEANP